MLTPDELKDRIIRSSICQAGKLRGCSDKDFKRVEDHIGHQLPKEYKNVMRVIGRGAGEFMSDLEMFYPRVVSLTDRMRELLSESGVDLPTGTFVFANRYGEQIFFFYLSENDDNPAIYRWWDDEPKRVRKVSRSLWDFIETELSSHEAMLSDENDVPDE